MASYQSIEQIQIGAFTPGTWRDAVIFSVDFDVGFNGDSTRLVINVVNITGDYDISEADLSYLNPYNIMFGPFQFRLYLESYEITKSAGKRLLRLTFVDGSTLLDRVYVALGDKHRKLNDAAWFLSPVNFPILCEAPEFMPPAWATNGLVNLSQRAIMPIRHSALDPSSKIRSAKLEAGGMITVGWETPSIENFHRDCALQDFKYNFTHFLAMVQNFGIGIEGDFLRRDAAGNVLRNRFGEFQYADRNPYHYKSTAGKTLKEVLNDWCAAQGYSWFYSFTSNAIVGIDEYSSTAWARFEKIKNLVNSIKSQSNDGARTDALIEQATETCTLAGTKKRYLTTSAIKNASPDNTTKREYYRAVKFSPLDSSHVIAPNQRGEITGLANTYRDDTQLRISSALAKYDIHAREIYNTAIGCHEANGFKILGEIDMSGGKTHAGMQIIMLTCLAGIKGMDLINTMNKWVDYWKIPFKMYFVKRDKTIGDAWLNWEKNVAEFYGKNYLNFDQMHRMLRCDKYGRGYFRREDETIPRSEEYVKEDIIQGRQSWPSHIKDILKSPYGLSLSINNNLFAFYNKFNLLQRTGAAWDVTQEEIDSLFIPRGQGNQKPHILKPWIPKYIQLPAGKAANIIAACFPHLNVAGGAGHNIAIWPNNIASFAGGLNGHNILNMINMQGHPNNPNRDQEIGILIHVDYNHALFPFKIKNASYVEYENLKEKSITDSMAMNAPWVDPCPLLCGGISPRQRLCEDLNRFFEPRPWPTGLERWNLGTWDAPYWTIPAFGFQLEFNFPPDNLHPQGFMEECDIVFPSWSAHIVNHKMNIERRLLDPKIQSIINSLDGPPLTDIRNVPGNVSSMEMIEYDVSSLASSDPTNSSVNISLPGALVNPWNLGANFPVFGENPLWDYMNVSKLHTGYAIAGEIPTQNAIMSLPRKTLSCSVAGMSFGSLAPFMSPKMGLEQVSIRLSQEDGVTSELKFSNKPPKPPDKDMMFRTIQTDLMRPGGAYPMF